MYLTSDVGSCSRRVKTLTGKAHVNTIFFAFLAVLSHVLLYTMVGVEFKGRSDIGTVSRTFRSDRRGRKRNGVQYCKNITTTARRVTRRSRRAKNQTRGVRTTHTHERTGSVGKTTNGHDWYFHTHNIEI